MKNKKHYYENEVKPNITTFNLPKNEIEVRGRFTEAQIRYIKFKWFWIGIAIGGILIAIIFYLQETNAI